jgi:hypothetical protein
MCDLVNKDNNEKMSSFFTYNFSSYNQISKEIGAIGEDGKTATLPAMPIWGRICPWATC